MGKMLFGLQGTFLLQYRRWPPGQNGRKAEQHPQGTGLGPELNFSAYLIKVRVQEIFLEH